MLDRGADIHAGKEAALNAAVGNRRHEAILLLLGAGADPTSATKVWQDKGGSLDIIRDMQRLDISNAYDYTVYLLSHKIQKASSSEVIDILSCIAQLVTLPFVADRMASGQYSKWNPAEDMADVVASVPQIKA